MFIKRNPTVSHIDDPDVIMQEAPDSSEGGYIQRPAVRLPPFWSDRPWLWFAQADAQCNIASVTSEKTKFNYVISQLVYRHAAGVENVIISPPTDEPYSTLKTGLVRRRSSSRDQCVRQLLTHEEMGHRKPSQFLRHLKNLAKDVPVGCRPTSRLYWLARPRATWTPPHNWPTGPRKSLRVPPMHTSPKLPNPLVCSRRLRI